MEDQREFVEHFQYGKQIGKILDIQNRQKRHRAPTHILLGLKSEKSGNQAPHFEDIEKYMEFARENSIPIIAANSPAMHVRCVGKKGADFISKFPQECVRADRQSALQQSHLSIKEGYCMSGTIA